MSWYPARVRISTGRTFSLTLVGRAALVGGVALSFGCTALVSQIPPSDLGALEALESREERQAAFAGNQIVVHKRINGLRYTKGNDLNTPESDWQSLDLLLRSDRVSAAALPDKKRRVANVMIGMAAMGGLATTTGIAATAGNGLDTTRLTAPGALLLGGAVVTVAFSVAAGILYGKMRKDYQRAVEVYNASLSMRLGLAAADGAYRPPGGVLVDPDGFVVLTPSGSFVRASNMEAYNEQVRQQQQTAQDKLTPEGTGEESETAEQSPAPEEPETGEESLEPGESPAPELAPEGTREDAAAPAEVQAQPATTGAGEVPRDDGQ